ncbi:MAG: anthranilate phosphoribosyltransferase [Actinomycetota bacterium]
MITKAIGKTVSGVDLSGAEAREVMDVIMSGAATDAQIAALLTALRMKGETVEEITAFASVMREKAEPVKLSDGSIVDTCGTGGDETGTFNISTTAAFVAAGAGARVGKHGNRSVSSKCGSADVLEALGVVIDLDAQATSKVIEEAGIGFLFAPILHTAMKYVMPARKQTGIRTVFNILGPLTNPAGASAQVLGVYSPALTETMALVLGNLGATHALVVHGAGGLDELSTLGSSQVSELKNGSVSTYIVRPEDLGLPRADISDLQGGEAAANAKYLTAVLDGEKGPRRDIVIMNASAALVAADLATDLRSGLQLAATSIDSGAARAKLARLVAVSRQYAEEGN